jgi:hypothetical protein
VLTGFIHDMHPSQPQWGVFTSKEFALPPASQPSLHWHRQANSAAQRHRQANSAAQERRLTISGSIERGEVISNEDGWARR